MISTINISRTSTWWRRLCHSLLRPRHRVEDRLAYNAHSGVACNYLFSSYPRLGNPDVLTCRPNSSTKITGLCPRFVPYSLRLTYDTQCPIVAAGSLVKCPPVHCFYNRIKLSIPLEQSIKTNRYD